MPERIIDIYERQVSGGRMQRCLDKSVPDNLRHTMDGCRVASE